VSKNSIFKVLYSLETINLPAIRRYHLNAG